MIFFQFKGTLAINLSPLNILKYSFLSKLSKTLVNFLKVLCSSITPYLFIVKQYLLLVLETVHRIFLLLYNHSFLVANSYRLNQLYLIYPNVCSQNINYQCLFKIIFMKSANSMYKIVHKSFIV